LARYNSDGTLDTSFADGGQVTTDFGGKNDQAYAAAIQSDGKIVVAGHAWNGSNNDFDFARYNSDGSLDTSFGTGGILTPNLLVCTGCNQEAYAVLQQPDNSLVIMGRVAEDNSGSTYNTALIRLNTDGTYDNTFDGDGIDIENLSPGNEEPRAMSLQSDGEFVVAGGLSGNAVDFFVARFNATGGLDSTFDGDGVSVVSGSAGTDRAVAVKALSDGKIAAIGEKQEGGTHAMAIRLESNGSLDATFGTGGIATIPISSPENNVYGGTFGTNDKIYAIGYEYPNSGDTRYDFDAEVFNADGTTDTGFDGDGHVVTPIGFNDESDAQGVAIQPDGKIVAVGTGRPSGGDDFVVVRYSTDGTLDTTFDGDGRSAPIEFEPGNTEQAKAVAIQSDGKIVVFGKTFSNAPSDYVFAFARLNADGSIDTSFGNNGRVTRQTGTEGVQTGGLLIQPDGKIVASGGDGGSGDMALLRYNSNGTPDTTFGDNGLVRIDIPLVTPLRGLAMQTDGKLVAAGYIWNGNGVDFIVARFNTNGSLDATFGIDGTAIVDYGGVGNPGGEDQELTGVAIQSDGKIVGVGFTQSVTTRPTGSVNTNKDFALLRLNSDGSRDATFGWQGVVEEPISAEMDEAYAVVIQPDGKIVAAGRTQSNKEQDMAVARFNADGSLDTTFGNAGRSIIDFGFDDAAYAIARQSDSKLVIAGNSGSFALARLAGDGAATPTPTASPTATPPVDPPCDLAELDQTFDTDGKVLTQVGTSDSAVAVAIQPDGKTVAVGSSRVTTNNDFAVVRYLYDGSLDTSFGGTGKVTTAILSDNDDAASVALQPDGKIVAAGNSSNGSDTDFALVRYNSNGTLDTTFNGTGKVTTAVGPSDDFAYEVRIQPDGKIIVIGESYNADYAPTFALVRYNTDGSLDTSFGTGGMAITTIGTFSSSGRSGVIQLDGKIVAVGNSYDGSHQNFAAARYNADGTLDTTFGTGGKVTTLIGNGSLAYSVAMQPDGKLLLSGSGHTGTHNAFAMAMYNTDGSLDSTFGTAGKVISDISTNQSKASSSLILNDGRIVLTGFAIDSGSSFAMARYNANGSLDTTFSGDGILLTQIGDSISFASDSAATADGRIVAVGGAVSGGSVVFALARFGGPCSPTPTPTPTATPTATP